MVRVKLPALQMKEHCAMAGTQVYVGARDVLPDQARGTISWREFKTVYDSLFEGPFTKAQGGGLRYMIGGSLLAHYRRRAVALMHAANAAAKLGGTASPMRGKRRSWPELVVDLRNQGTGVLRALALW